MIIILCFIVAVIRLFWLSYFKKSYHIGFLVPLFLEIVFVYPYTIMDSLELKWTYFGFLVNYSIVLTVQIGAALTINLPARNVKFYIKNESYYFIVALIVLSFLGVISNLSSYSSLSSGVSGLLELSHQNAVDRYDGSQNVSLLYKISSLFAYFLTFLLSMLYATERKRKTLLCIVFHFLILLLDSILMAARAGLLLQLFCFLANFYAFSYYNANRASFNISIRKILYVIMFVLIIFSFFVLIQIVRGGKTEYDIFAIVSHVITWFVGYIPGFDFWITHLYRYELTFGQRTFVGIFDLLGITQRVSGVYPAIDIGNGRYSNIFTAYRGLIEDFSFFGLYIILFLLGILLPLIPNYTISSGRCFFAPFSGFILFFFFWSYVINPYSYNVIFFSAILFWFYFSIFVRVKYCD